MKLVTAVTFLVSAVMVLASSAWSAESVAANSSSPSLSDLQNYSTSILMAKKSGADSWKYAMQATIARSTSLVDFQDGSRSDSMDFKLNPSLTFGRGGTIATEIAYSQNLRDEEDTQAGFMDIPVSYSFRSVPLNLLNGFNTKIGYSVTAVAPVSKLSTKRDQLQTSLSGKVKFSLTPKDDGFSASTSVSVGRNFHEYEEDINGNVLNQYSSNQTLSLGYGYNNWSFSTDYIHRTRWTYKGNIKTSFELDEEIGYDFSKAINVAVGHTNAGSTLKANGTDSNIDFYNENSSMVYASLTLSY